MGLVRNGTANGPNAVESVEFRLGAGGRRLLNTSACLASLSVIFVEVVKNANLGKQTDIDGVLYASDLRQCDCFTIKVSLSASGDRITHVPFL